MDNKSLREFVPWSKSEENILFNACRNNDVSEVSTRHLRSVQSVVEKLLALIWHKEKEISYVNTMEKKITRVTFFVVNNYMHILKLNYDGIDKLSNILNISKSELSKLLFFVKDLKCYGVDFDISCTIAEHQTKINRARKKKEVDADNRTETKSYTTHKKTTYLSWRECQPLDEPSASDPNYRDGLDTGMDYDNHNEDWS